jgi:hypothetical protein
MKSTFITLCGKDRASRDAIKRVTHTPTKRDAFDGYDRDSHWDEMCEAVAKLRLNRRRIQATTAITCRLMRMLARSSGWISSSNSNTRLIVPLMYLAAPT